MSIKQWDYSMFQHLNNLADHVPLLDLLMRFFSLYAEYIFYVGILLYWFTRTPDNRKMVIQALSSACVAFGVGSLLSHVFYRDRPFVTHAVHQLIAHPANASFPSDHSIGAFVIAASFYMFRRSEGKAWLALAGCIALSRVWTGVHYPLDVVSGALIGILSAAAVHELFAKWSVLRRLMKSVVGIYERVELKVWPK